MVALEAHDYSEETGHKITNNECWDNVYDGINVEPGCDRIHETQPRDPQQSGRGPDGDPEGGLTRSRLPLLQAHGQKGQALPAEIRVQELAG
ncbi:hypothetical protein E3J20_05540 [Candidatus Bathyarchaeota archaeon]|nr:MAG: hypothetical protein E3J20_05540 [Candidatus Bathyarchaeota archaeon]